MASPSGKAVEKTQADGDDAALSGWLVQRGPTDRHRWRNRWCVLSGDMLNIYETESCQVQRSSLTLCMSSRAVPFVDEHAPGESAMYSHERPHGFVLDVDPECTAGKYRRMQYFDAGSAGKLRRWVRAFRRNSCLSQLASFIDDSAGTLQTGDVLVVVEDLVTDSSERLQLNVGDFGTVVLFDDKGDASIRFDGHPAPQWVKRKNFHKLRKERAGVAKPVFLDLIPQSALIMHWAIRVGSLDLVRNYEFELHGVLIGKCSGLHCGFPTQTLALDGKTCRSHTEIEQFAVAWGARNSYCPAGGNTFGGKNCQDFGKELCEFLGLKAGQLPVRQAQQVKGFLGAGLGAAGLGVVAVGTDMGVSGAVAAGALGVGLPQIAVGGLVLGAGVVAVNGIEKLDGVTVLLEKASRLRPLANAVRLVSSAKRPP